MKKCIFISLLVVIIFITACNNKIGGQEILNNNLWIKYLGHGSLKMHLPNNKICYIDPYAGDDYSEKADLVLVTHQHPDHNKLDLLKMDDDTILFQNHDAIVDNNYNNVEFHGMKIEPVEAYNQNHKKEECVGFVLRINDKVIYIAGDTSKTEQMSKLADYNIDYAFLPMDGKFNMDVDEAIECAELIKAKHTIPYHMQPGSLFSEERAILFDTPSTLILRPNDVLNID